MPLTCPSHLQDVDLGFTRFIDCSSINVSYDLMGIATITFTVISVTPEPTSPSYTSLSFGGVGFHGFVTSVEIGRMPGTLVYELRYTFVGIGCATGAQTTSPQSTEGAGLAGGGILIINP